MADLLFRDCDADKLASLVTVRVVDAVREIMAESAHPHLVDRQRMSASLGVSLPTLDRMVAAGEVPSILVGTRRLFEPGKVIDALVERNRESTGD